MMRLSPAAYESDQFLISYFAKMKAKTDEEIEEKPLTKSGDREVQVCGSEMGQF